MAERSADISDEWDAFVASHPSGHHEQTSMYGVERRKYGYEARCVAVREQGCIIGGAQVLVMRTPLGRIAHVRSAPLARDDAPEQLDAVVRTLRDHARDTGITSLRVDTLPNQAAARAALERGGFRSADGWAERVVSRTFDLTLDDDTLMKRMRPKGRYNLRLARRSGVEVQVGGAELLKPFYNLHVGTASHQGFPVFPITYYDELLALLRPAGRIWILLATVEGQYVSAICNIRVGDCMYYCWGGLERDSRHLKAMPNYLLHFTALQLAREQGCVTYDLIGDTQFKRKLTDQLTAWPASHQYFSGKLAGVRRGLFEAAGSRPRVQRLVRRAARRLGMRPKMPY